MIPEDVMMAAAQAEHEAHQCGDVSPIALAILKERRKSKAYEAGYNDARADALRELQYAMRDISEGDTAKARLEQLYDDIQTIAMPQDARGKG